MTWLVLYARNARIGSIELTEANLATLQREFCMTLIQRDATGTEHWAALAPRRRS